MQFDFSERTVLVTGSNKNTGEIIATSFARLGATVIVHSLSPDDPQASAPDLQGATHIVGDIATEDGCDAVLEQIQSKALNVDILVNNYGTAEFATWEKSSTEQWLDMYQKNVLSAVRLIQGLTGGMKQRGWGRIVNLGTIGSHRPGSIMPHYYSAKGALATLGVSLAQELTGTGINVNTVSPGLIHTPDLEAGYRARAAKKGWGDNWDDILQHIVDKDFPNPCQRLATRQEVADLVVFLCAEQSGFINGQNIRIDGGAIAYV